MSDGEKLHMMLEFMSKVHSLTIHTEPAISTHAKKKTYTYEQLLKAFKKPSFGRQLSIEEIGRLCAIITMDGLGTAMKKPGFENTIGGTIGISIDHLKVSEAYTSKKYLSNEKPSFVDSNLIKWIVVIFANWGFLVGQLFLDYCKAVKVNQKIHPSRQSPVNKKSDQKL
ncbi:MAG TPA: hypothetical protein VGQ59_05630 [Cyclobacteriaceae bacterium]|nr:hypothetical protein [Cyclobacteriaceae bacterium]